MDMDTKETIIVVDDNRDVLSIVEAMLQTKGYNVLTAYSSTELFACLKEKKPDLILLDILMPDVNGLEVLSRLKSAPETSSISVILLTALTRHEDILKGYNAGADYYISKPFTRTTLLNGVKLILEGRTESDKQLSLSFG